MYNQSDIIQHHNFFDAEDYEIIKEKTGYGSKWQFGHTSLGRDHPRFPTCLPFWKIDFVEDTFFTEHLLNKIQQKLDTSFDLFISIGGDGTILRAITCKKNLGIPISNICFVLKGKYKTAGGYKFKYIDE